MKVTSIFVLLLHMCGALACEQFSRDGEFIREDFFKYLEMYKTHRSDQPKGLTGVVVDQRLKEVDFIWNFHEGDISRRADKDCSLHRIDQKMELPRYSYKFLSEDSFLISDGVNDSYKFIRVESFGKAINENLIVGNFSSDDGTVYRFTGAGELDVAGRRYEYRLVIDRIEFDADLLVIESNPRVIMKFEWGRGSLYLYKLNKLTGDFEKSAVILTPTQE